MPSIDTVITTGWKNGRKPHVLPVGYEIANRFGPLYYMWGPGRAGTTGDHNKGLAIDFSVLDKGNGPESTWVNHPGPARPALGQAIAEYLVANRDRLNLTYVIWNRRIASNASSPDWSWRPYDNANAMPHTDHVHASFETTGTYHEPPEDDDMANAQDVLEAVASLRAYVREAYLDTTNKVNTFEERERNRDANQDVALARLEAAIAKLQGES